MKKALLVEPQKGQDWGNNNQYVGLLRVGRWLQATGYDVRYAVMPDLPAREEFSPETVYVTSMFTYDYPNVWDAVHTCKRMYPAAEVQLGGVYATICHEHAMQSGADVVYQGRHAQARFYPPNPNLLPERPQLAYLFTSYGCNRGCTYCATHLLFGKGMEQSDPQIVISEIKYLTRLGYRRIRFGDDNILFNAENHINRVCEEILHHGVKARFEVPGGMTAKELTQETLDLMRRAGFEQFSFAIESVSDAVLKKMGRADHTDREDLTRAVEMCERSGLKRRDIDVYFLIGLPYQTLESMVDTLVFLLGLGVWAHPQRLTPIPHTVEWKRMKLEDWDYRDLYYRDFVAPDQDNFTGDDLNAIYLLARMFNVGSRLTSGVNWLTQEGRVQEMFRQKLRETL